MLDLIQGAALLEDLSQVPGDEELRDRHQGVEERTHAQDDEQDLDDLPGEIRRRRIRPHRRHRVEGEEEPLPNRDVLGQ